SKVDDGRLPSGCLLRSVGESLGTPGLWDGSATFLVASVEANGAPAVHRFLDACLSVTSRRPRTLVALRDVAQLVLGDQLPSRDVLNGHLASHLHDVVVRAVANAWRTFNLGDAVALSVWARRHEATLQQHELPGADHNAALV